MVKKAIYLLLIILLLADICYSFVQHYTLPLDGDMPAVIVPIEEQKPVITNNPFGFDAIINNQKYVNPNRYFCHIILKKYFEIVPIFLQKFTEPINSVYLSCAIAKTIFQTLLIFLISISVVGFKNILKKDFLIVAVLITPLFQTNGYRKYMAIIDPSTTYAFFYALPLVLLFIYLIPFILQFYHKEKIKGQIIIKFLWIPLAIVICLSGPLNPAIVLIFSMLIFFHRFINNYQLSQHQKIMNKSVDAFTKIPKEYWLYFLPINLFSLYSIYLGKYNAYNINVPLIELYSKLPLGIYYQFTQKIGFPVLFIIITVNIIIINKYFKTLESERIITLFKWIGVFALIYILLLPFGGYRIYRPYILRYDTIIPITVSIIFLYGLSTLYILKRITEKHKYLYITLIVFVLFIFTNSDKPEFNQNTCERNSLKEIAESKKNVVEINNNCSILAWGIITKPEHSEASAQLMLRWRITKEKKLYYQKE